MTFPDLASFALFLAAAVVLLVTPGPAVLYIVGRSIEQGRSAGIVSTLGVAAGSLVHVIAAALGISALLLSSALAFGVVKYVGAAYLVYLGLRRLLGRDAATRPVMPRAGLGSIFYQGALVNLLNPKTALFFFAFLPQFVDPVRGSVAEQIFALGAIFVAMGIVSDGAYALLAGGVGEWLRRRPAVLGLQRYLVGGLFVGLGLSAAFAGSGKK